ncbi:MAG: hypothetical protein Q4A76_05260 [Porphyromonadaceae bacterium]|nr:hypothetical protein [Porphyromonadaceae bacterium]
MKTRDGEVIRMNENTIKTIYKNSDMKWRCNALQLQDIVKRLHLQVSASFETNYNRVVKIAAEEVRHEAKKLYEEAKINYEICFKIQLSEVLSQDELNDLRSLNEDELIEQGLV